MNHLSAEQAAEEIVDSSVLVAQDRARLLSNCRLASRLAGLLGVCVGLVVLIGGWACDIAALRTLVRGYPIMAPNTALGLLLCGAALWLGEAVCLRGAGLLLFRVCSGVTGMIGAITLIQDLLGKDFGIDRLMFPHSMMLFAPDGMAAMSPVSLLLLGSALLLSRQRLGFAVGQYLTIVAGGVNLFIAIGYLYGIRVFYLTFQAESTPMALHTSLMFVVLCAGVLFSRPGWGLLSTINSPAPGGVMARRLLPAALLIPVAVGWLGWQGELMGFYDTAFGLALFTAINVGLFTFLIWRSGRILNTLDKERAWAEGSLRQLADSMPQIVWTARADGSLDYCNRHWCDYSGMSLDQTRHSGWRPVLHPDDLQNCIERWEQAFTVCQPYEIEYRYKRASDGVYRWHLGRALPIRDTQGTVVRWFGTSTDIEDYKQAEAQIRSLNEGLEERVRERTLELAQANQELARANVSSLRLEQSNRELHDFASVASHDLQEPLRKVQAFGDRLKTAARDTMNDQSRDYLDRMLNAAKRMQSLIHDLLRFARVANQTQPFLPVDLADVTREVLSDLELRIAETNAVVEVGDLPTIDADAVHMRQLLQNLIGNALKFHQNGSALVVRVYSEKVDLCGVDDGMFRLVVADNGIGFDEKYLDRIFTLFQRLHGRTEYEGTGMGLAVCRKIAQLHGGDITARSKPGQGASFLVTLPLRHAFGDRSQIPNPGANVELGILSALHDMNSSGAEATSEEKKGDGRGVKVTVQPDGGILTPAGSVQLDSWRS